MGTLCAATLAAQSAGPSLRIVLPERTRLLQGQLIDLVLEVRNTKAVTNVKVMAGSVDISSKFGSPLAASLDCDGSSSFVVRANFQSFNDTGTVKLSASLDADGAALSDSRDILVRPFSVPDGGTRRNLVLFIGDAMGTAYSDAARLVARAHRRCQWQELDFREGFFDNLLEMDKMPVSGMSMTYGTDSVVPDSANTGTAWATGNKSFLNAVNSFADGTDCKWRFNGAAECRQPSLHTGQPARGKSLAVSEAPLRLSRGHRHHSRRHRCHSRRGRRLRRLPAGAS